MTRRADVKRQTAETSILVSMDLDGTGKPDIRTGIGFFGNCGRNKAVNCLKELDQEKGIGLIEKRRIGLGKTNVIYVKNFSLTEYPDEPAIFDSEETPENVAERKENTETEIEEYAKKEPEKPVNTQKFEKQTS